MTTEGPPSELTLSSPTPDAHARFRMVIRWLKGLTVLAIGSWVLLGLSLLLHVGEETADGNGRLASPNDVSPDLARGATGPWGVLMYVPIGISPPPEIVPESAPFASSQVEWHFPDILAERLPAMLLEIGLSEPLREKLVAAAEIDPGNGGFTVRPTREIVLELSPEDRKALYVTLAACPDNIDQQGAFRFCGESLDQWLEGSSLDKETRSLIEPLVYRQGNVMFFADLRSVEPSLTSDQRQDLVKALSRESTFLMRLEVSPDSDVGELVEYWGRGGRARDVQPILESARRSDGSHSIDVMHLLPPFARQRLYTYDAFTTEASRRNRDCHWSAMNFFADQPDDRFLDLEEVLQTLSSDYYRIFANPQLGDVILFIDSERTLVHSAVYVADDVVFTKNGRSPSHPWMFMNLDDMMDFYPRRHGMSTRFFRRKDL